ncbi:MAG: MerR family transcriptional regulator [Acidimicrobiales bacterium]
MSTTKVTTINRSDQEAGFRGPQVCSIVGITYGQLDYWARTDLLRPSISDARGSGTQRRYSYTDLVQLKVVKRLLDAGISLQSARRAIDCLRSSGEDLATANLVIDEGRTVLAHSGEEIVDLLKGGQGVLNIVPMASLVSEIRSAITDLHLTDAGADSRPGADAADREVAQPTQPASGPSAPPGRAAGV